MDINKLNKARLLRSASESMRLAKESEFDRDMTREDFIGWLKANGFEDHGDTFVLKREDYFGDVNYLNYRDANGGYMNPYVTVQFEGDKARLYLTANEFTDDNGQKYQYRKGQTVFYPGQYALMIPIIKKYLYKLDLATKGDRNIFKLSIRKAYDGLRFAQDIKSILSPIPEIGMSKFDRGGVRNFKVSSKRVALNVYLTGGYFDEACKLLQEKGVNFKARLLRDCEVFGHEISQNIGHSLGQGGEYEFVFPLAENGIEVYNDKARSSTEDFADGEDLFMDEILRMGDDADELAERHYLPIEYELMSSKEVYDQDGFTDIYEWWMNPENGNSKFFFGDTEDWETDSMEEAQEWFDNYHGFEEESEYLESGTDTRTGDVYDNYYGKNATEDMSDDRMFDEDSKKLNQYFRKAKQRMEKGGLSLSGARKYLTELCTPMMDDLIASGETKLHDRLDGVIQDLKKELGRIKSKKEN